MGPPRDDGQVHVSFGKQFLRSIGLGVVNDLIGLARTKGKQGRPVDEEPKKIVISSSRWLVLSRCGVHILPILVSIAIIVINLKQLYIGIDFNSAVHSETINLALLQTAAKFQELLIVASLATIIFQLTRDELFHDDGLPLGLLGAGLEFTKLSFFWSPRMLGSLTSLFRRPFARRRILLALFLMLAGTIALLSGPACAILLVPQMQDWPAGGTSVSLNGTPDDFWPVEVVGSLPNTSVCSSSVGSKYGVCPSGGFSSLWSHYSRLNSSNYANIVSPYAYDLSGNHYYWQIDNLAPVSTRTMSLGQPSSFVYIVQPHLAISIILDQLMKDWWAALLKTEHLNDQQIADREAVSTPVLNPHVGVLCAPAEKLSFSNSTINFPTFDSPSRVQAQSVPPDFLSSTSADHLQFSWLPLPNSFRYASTGAVLQFPWDSDAQSRLVVGCSISAHWVPANIRSDAYTFWEGWYPKSIGFDNSYPTKGDKFLNGSFNNNFDAIKIDQSWLDALTPPTPIQGPGYQAWEPSTIESILTSVGITDGADNNGKYMTDAWQPLGDTNRPGLLASIIASVFADGLARTGVERLFETHGNPSQWTLAPYEKADDFDNLIVKGHNALRSPNNNNTFSVQFAISGLNYSTSLGKQLAMVVLFLHMAIALVHTVWTTARGKSSACWDSMTELVVLAQNSRPAFKALNNTAAGVQNSSTFAKSVVVRPTQLPNAHEADHLELLLLEEEESLIKQHEKGSTTSFDYSTRSSIAQDDSKAIEVTQEPRSATWPLQRRSADAHHKSSVGYLPENNLSSPNTPLLPDAECLGARVVHNAHVEVDKAYG